MDFPEYYFRDGGEFMYVVLGLGLFGMMVGTAVAIVAAFGKWTPAPAWWAVPSAVITAGSVGTYLGCGIALRIMGEVSPEGAMAMAAAGHSVAAYTDIFGLSVAAVLLGSTAFFGGLAHAIGAGQGAKWNILPALAWAVPGVLGGVALAAWAHMGAREVTLTVLAPAVVAVCGVGCGVGVLRTRVREDAESRTAATRMHFAVVAVVAVWCAGRAAVVAGESVVFKALATASPEYKSLMVAHGEELASLGRSVGLVGLSIVLVLGIATVAGSASHLSRKRTMISAVLGLFVLLPALGVRGLTHTRMSDLAEFTELAVWDALEGNLPNLPTDLIPTSARGPERFAGLTGELIVDTEHGWRKLEPGADRPIEAGLPLGVESADPTVLVSGSTTARRLVRTRFRDGPARIYLLTRSEGSPAPAADTDPRRLGLATVTIDIERGAWSPEKSAWYVVDSGHDGLEVATALLPELGGGDFELLVLVPGSSWTVQDIATLCRTAAGVEYRRRGRSYYSDPITCVLAESLPRGVAPEGREGLEGFGRWR